MDEIEFLDKVDTFFFPRCSRVNSETSQFCQASRTPGRGSEYVVGLLDSFKHVGPNGTHVCMVFEPMGYNLLSLIKFYDYRGVPIDIVRQIARQVNDRQHFLSGFH